MSGQDHFGPYTLIAPIAQTGISVSHAVQVAVRPRIDRLATLTLVHRSLTQQSEFADALLQSVKETDLLNHPNISHVFDYAVRDGNHYLVSEFTDGTSLKDLLDHPNLGDELAVYIVSQLAIAVAHAHARRSTDGQKVEVIHGDIRPTHVHITEAGAVKLSGYAIGSARAALDTDPAAASAQPNDLFAYTEPAQARGEAPTANADLFSLGALLWSLLAKEALFAGDSAAATREAAKVGDIRSIRSLRPDLDDELAAIVMATLGVEEETQRPIQSAQSLRTALSAWARAKDSNLGRTELKAAFDDTFVTDAPWSKTRPLTAREFTPQDPHSLIHTVGADVEDPGVSTSVDALWDVTPAAPTRAAAVAAPPKAKPQTPAEAPRAPAAPQAPPAPATSTAPTPPPATTVFAPIEVPEEDESSLDDQTVEYSQIEEEDDVIVLDLDEDIVDEAEDAPIFEDDEFDDETTVEYSPEEHGDLPSSAPPSAPPQAPAPSFSGRPTREVPAAKIAPPPQPATDDEPAEKPGLAALLAASRASQALRGERAAEDVGTALPPRAATAPSKGRPAQATPSVEIASVPPERPKEAPKKGSISLDDIRPSDEAFAVAPPLAASTAGVPSPTEAAAPAPQPTIAPEAPQPAETPQAPAPDTQEQPAPETPQPSAVDPSPSERTLAATAAAAAAPKAKKEPTFDPTAIYDEESAVVDYTQTYDDTYHEPSPTKGKKKPNFAIIGLAVVVLLLVGYIVYSNLSGDSSGATEQAPVALRVESDPGRAHIFIDGEDTGEVTPHTFDQLTAGAKVSVHVSRAGYEDSEQKSLELTAGSVHTERFELASLKHTINLSSTPEGATVYIDGQEQGTTPTVIGPIEANPTLGVNIHLQLKGHRPRAIQHTWTGDQRTSDVNITLDPL